MRSIVLLLISICHWECLYVEYESNSLDASAHTRRRRPVGL
jgi:hypothetical protein